MDYYHHHTNAFGDEKIQELYKSCGFEGLGLFYTALEFLAKSETPLDHSYLKRKLGVKEGGNLECWGKIFELKLLKEKEGKIYNTKMLNFVKKEKDLIPTELRNAMVETYIKVHEELLSIKPINYKYSGLKDCYKSILVATKEINTTFEFTPETMSITFERILRTAYLEFYGKQLQLTTINKYISVIISTIKNNGKRNPKNDIARTNNESSREALRILSGEGT
jgi:hypothetical protein